MAVLAVAPAIVTQQPGPAASPEAPPPFQGDRGFSAALVSMLRSGDLPAALALLESRPDIAATPAGVRLRAELLARLGRPSEAIALLEGHLARDSADALARYQIAEIHFAARRDRSATLAYRLALSGRLDAERRRLIEERLSAIEARRDLRLSFSLAVAPDSNINSATGDSTIELYGLPFTLSDDARRRSGVSVSVGASIERRLALSDRYALVTGGSLALLDASGRTFDQRQVGLFTGPEIRLSQHTRIALAATWRDVDFGGSSLETWHGVLLSGQTYVDPRTRWDGSLHVDRLRNHNADALSGTAYGLQLGRTRFLGPSALWRVSLAVDRHDLAGSEAGYREARAAAGRLFALPWSSLAYAESYAQTRTFDQRSSVFGVRRDDREIGVSVRISKRDWAFHNAFPYVQATVSEASSNVALGRFSRQRIEFGLTRDF